jgi:hypothetical protein
MIVFFEKQSGKFEMCAVKRRAAVYVLIDMFHQLLLLKMRTYSIRLDLFFLSVWSAMKYT